MVMAPATLCDRQRCDRLRPAQMFDPEVLVELRRTFDSADADGSGSIDVEEACTLFAKYMDPGSSPFDIKRTAANLVSTLDTDRSGKLSFEEFAFRFGRKLQMELARKRRAGSAVSTSAAVNEDVIERQHACPSDGLHAPPGAYMRRSAAPAYTRSAPPPPHDNTSRTVADRAEGETTATGASGREYLTVLGIAASLLALLAFAVFVPAPGAPGEAGGGARSRSRSQGRTHGR